MKNSIHSWIFFHVIVLLLSSSCNKNDENISSDTPNNSISSFIDTRDGKVYKTIKIGEKIWMAENLNVGNIIQSTHGGSQQSDNNIIEKYCYDNDSLNCDIYGGLYEWDEMMQYNLSDSGTVGIEKGICPDGWHVPTDAEWTTLINYLGGESIAGGKMKETGTIHWDSPNVGATNSSGYSALPAGFRNNESALFGNLIYLCYWWSATEQSDLRAWERDLGHGYTAVYRNKFSKDIGLSVRCIKDYSGGVTGNEPIADFSASLTSVSTGGVVSFTDQSSYTPTSWTWTFSGGTPSSSTTQNPSVTYNISGTYTVTLLATNRYGSDVETKTEYVMVSPTNCPSSIIDSRDGKTYSSVQIGSLCLMAQNLNVGTMISSTTGGQLQTDNAIIEKYCYANIIDSCSVYGGLYEWNEMMQYNSSDTGVTGSVQGICPDGWHIPTDTEWKALEMYLGMSQSEANTTGYRGINEGSKLAGDSSLWMPGNLTSNAEFGTSGFAGLPSGFRAPGSLFYYNAGYADFWSATEYNSYFVWRRRLDHNNADVSRYYSNKENGYSVRCIKN